MKGSVIPSNFFRDADDFEKNGIGFSLFEDDNLATTAYSAFIQDNKIELGMETLKEYRGKGYAQLACAALIDYCIAHKYDPVWACRLENIGSFKLAQKLGFQPTEELKYYRLSN